MTAVVYRDEPFTWDGARWVTDGCAAIRERWPLPDARPGRVWYGDRQGFGPGREVLFEPAGEPVPDWLRLDWRFLAFVAVSDRRDAVSITSPRVGDPPVVWVVRLYHDGLLFAALTQLDRPATPAEGFRVNGIPLYTGPVQSAFLPSAREWT